MYDAQAFGPCDEDAEDYFETGSFIKVEAEEDLALILTFTDGTTRECQIAAADILEAFLRLDAEGLVPEIGAQWRAAVTRSLAQASRYSPLPLARFIELRPVDGVMCHNCSAEYHGLFRAMGKDFLIERSSIVLAILAMIELGALRPLPLRWIPTLETAYERICQTGSYTQTKRQGGSGNV